MDLRKKLAFSPKRWWSGVALGAAAVGTSAFLIYSWYRPLIAAGCSFYASVVECLRRHISNNTHFWYRWNDERKEAVAEESLSLEGENSSRDSEVEKSCKEAVSSLENHFHSIQKISDHTTLPQLLVETEAGLNRVANAEALISKLRYGGRDDSVGVHSKIDLWQELKMVTWTRAILCIWLVTLANLLLRVQLNILGRHLFLQTHLLETELPGTQRVTGAAQEKFIEYAHYLPEQACGDFAAILYRIVGQELGSTSLSQPLSSSQVLTCMSSIHTAFEQQALERGWPELVLPTAAEAARYFGVFRQSAPGTAALGPSQQHEPDDEVMQGMVHELYRVVQSSRFSCAVRAAAQSVARLFATHLSEDLGQSSLPMAKLLPRILAVESSLLQGSHPVTGGYSWLEDLAELPQVQDLCASVYACALP